jgi:phosphoserine phosphatase
MRDREVDIADTKSSKKPNILVIWGDAIGISNLSSRPFRILAERDLPPRFPMTALVRILLVVTLASACSGPSPSSAPPTAAPATSPAAPAAAPLPSWNDGVAKKAIIDFVGRVTREGGQDFVPPAERIATFDNDGTLWSEQPIYFQVAFAFDRVKALAPKHPEWKQKQPFKGLLEGDMKAVAASGEKGLLEVMAATHAGNTTDEFAAIVTDWIATARHPKHKRSYADLVYQPMLEVLAYLRANGFKTFIVSGGGVEFMRPWVERVYGIQPEQVVGSRPRSSTRCVTGSPCWSACLRSTTSTTRPGSPSASTRSSAAAPRSPSATLTATSRCSSGRRQRRARGSA